MDRQRQGTDHEAFAVDRVESSARGQEQLRALDRFADVQRRVVVAVPDLRVGAVRQQVPRQLQVAVAHRRLPVCPILAEVRGRVRARGVVERKGVVDDVQRVVAELVARVHGHAAGQQLPDAVQVAVARRDPDVFPVAALVAAAQHRHSSFTSWGRGTTAIEAMEEGSAMEAT